jgi:hypothetical protein
MSISSVSSLFTILINSVRPVITIRVVGLVFCSVFYSVLLVCGLSTIYSPVAEAGVFRCEKANGEIEFRDKPCDLSGVSGSTQSFLPHQYQKTDKKAVQVEEKKIEKQIQRLAVVDRKEDRLKQKAEKKQLKEQAKAERRKLRCERLEEKITHLEHQLQQGKKIKTYKRLQAELEHAELMKKRYCSAAS